MHGHHRARPRAHHRQDVVGVDQQVVGVDVDQHRVRASADNGFGGGDERVRREHDLVARSDVDRAQREFQGIGAVADADTVRHAEEVGVLQFEGTHRFAADKIAGRHDFGETCGDLGLDRLVLDGEVNQRHPGGHAAPRERAAPASTSTTRSWSDSVMSWNSGRISERSLRCSVTGNGTCGRSA